MSDLDRARQASRRLTARAARGRGLARPLPASPAVAQPPAAPAQRGVDEAPAALWQTEHLGSRFWNEVLRESMELASDEAPAGAFAVDAQGLVIASVGDLPEEQVAGTGSRLVIAREQVDRMESFENGAAAILIEFDDRWLSALSLRSGSGRAVTVALVAREPLPRETRNLIAERLSEALLRG